MVEPEADVDQHPDEGAHEWPRWPSSEVLAHLGAHASEERIAGGPTRRFCLSVSNMAGVIPGYTLRSGVGGEDPFPLFRALRVGHGWADSGLSDGPEARMAATVSCR